LLWALVNAKEFQVAAMTLAKALLLVPLGVMVGLWVDVSLVESMSDYHPGKGPLLGAISGQSFGSVFGKQELSALTHRIMVGILVGMATGGFLGAFVYAPSRVAENFPTWNKGTQGITGLW